MYIRSEIFQSSCFRALLHYNGEKAQQSKLPLRNFAISYCIQCRSEARSCCHHSKTMQHCCSSCWSQVWSFPVCLRLTHIVHLPALHYSILAVKVCRVLSKLLVDIVDKLHYETLNKSVIVSFNYK